MEKKTKSKPMKNILGRLNLLGEFDITIMTDKQILEEPQEEWPDCDALISFHSDGFPLTKAIAFAQRTKTLQVNHLDSQVAMLDRRRVYEILIHQQIPIPKHAFCNRDGWNGVTEDSVLFEADDYIEIDGQRINKPFVEKPNDSEDHNIYIYYPMAAGGGSKRLFRKIGDLSSKFYPHESEVRKEGSFIYEEFLSTQGTDVKVYTVGPDYAHAEARKSPVLDGKVIRNSQGKEMRYPVILTPKEKKIARKVRPDRSRSELHLLNLIAHFCRCAPRSVKTSAVSICCAHSTANRTCCL
jgi:inositol hexakisphosphate/diphosphoinositol-pentakisphosphate kinase